MVDLRNWIGIPYAEQNCLQLAIAVARSRGFPVPSRSEIWEMPQASDDWWAWWEPRESAEPGDVVVVCGNPHGVGTLDSQGYVLTTTPDTNSMLVRRRTFLALPISGIYRPRKAARLPRVAS